MAMTHFSKRSNIMEKIYQCDYVRKNYCWLERVGRSYWSCEINVNNFIELNEKYVVFYTKYIAL